MATTHPLFVVRAGVESDPPSGCLTLDTAGSVFESLSAEPARSLVRRIYERPATPTELAAAVGTSLETVRPHLDRLEAADLVEVVETEYAPDGRSTKVYGPAREPPVIVAGEAAVDAVQR